MTRFRACGFVVVFLLLVNAANSRALIPINRGPTQQPLDLKDRPVLADEKVIPFSQELDGLSCRLVFQPNYVPGQALYVAVQVRNNSKIDRMLTRFFNPSFDDFCKLTITGPDGKVVPQFAKAKIERRGLGHTVIAAGETWQMDWIDLQNWFAIDPRKPGDWPIGKYKVTFSYEVDPLHVKVKTGDRFDRIRAEPVPTGPTAEQLKNAWAGTLEWKGEFEIVALEAKDWAVHEWGVFTVLNDQKYANVNRKEEWGNLPPFFYRQFPQRVMRFMPTVIDKPIVYFYTPRQMMKFEMEVKFAGGGAPVAWWPKSSRPGESDLNQEKGAKSFDTIAFEGTVGYTPILHHAIANGTIFAKPVLQGLEADHWLNQARLEGAAMVTVEGGLSGGGRGQFQSPAESEKFIFYDGLAPSPDDLRAVKVEADVIRVKNRSKHELGAIYMVDRRDVNSPRYAIGKAGLAGGAEMDVSLTAAMEPGAFRQAIMDELKGRGLHESEATSIIGIWKKGFFENTGVVAFHVMSREEYDRMLPVKMKPMPVGGMVRVGIAFVPNFENDAKIQGDIDKLIVELDSLDFKVRENARTQLITRGPTAIVQLREALASTASPEVRNSIELILEKVDAASWLKP